MTRKLASRASNQPLPASSVNFRDIETLIPYARNARTHSDAQVAQIAASILEFGWTNPVLADEDGIVAGHGRLLAARQAPGQAVYDPFSGSGTTIIAAEMTGRACCAIELNPAYVDVAVTRWEQFTGKAAVLEGDARTFAEVLAERTPAGKIKAVAHGA